MIKFLLRRFVQMAILFVIFLTVVYLLVQLMPGDISDTLIGNPDIPLEVRLEWRDRLGLDEPLHIQYFTYITNFFKGDMGVSFSRYPKEVSEILWTALPRTIVLFLTATVFAFWLGFKSGKLLAWGRGGKVEQPLIIGGVFLQTVFYPWFAIVMLWLFGFYLDWFPLNGFIDVGVWTGSGLNADAVFRQMILSVLIVTLIYGLMRYVIKRVSTNIEMQTRLRQGAAILAVGGLVLYWWLSPDRVYVADIAHHLILPVFTLGLVAFGATMLLTRAAMLETLGEDYILTARAKGLSDHTIRDRHAARNAMLPVTTSLVLALSFVIGGGIVTETIFSWPGMGLVFLQAILVSDIPLAIGALSITGVLALLGHLVADLLYSALDPRIRIT